MIELYKMYLRVHWKLILLWPCLISLMLLIHTVKKGFNLDDGFANSSEMNGFFAFISSMTFFYSLAMMAPREMGIDSIALLPISRKELAYVRYLLPLTTQALIVGVTIMYPILILDWSGFLQIAQSCLQFVILGNFVLALFYLATNLFENLPKNMRWFKIILGVTIGLCFINKASLPALDLLEIILLGAFTALLVAIEIFTFQRFRTFRIS
ncbi:MAG: hypothetical protein EOP07_22000 [Proteobacteria bacterium]|nr:MAG: hypothetical protein EOP07_22000 [Pseudomonadota bacterium]